jgi:hypothetical protein
MLLKVANDDVASFRNNNHWLVHHPNKAIVFDDLSNVWSDLKSTYKGDFKNLVYDELPESELVLETMKKIKERLSSVVWNVKIGAEEES